MLTLTLRPYSRLFATTLTAALILCGLMPERSEAGDRVFFFSRTRSAPAVTTVAAVPTYGPVVMVAPAPVIATTQPSYVVLTAPPAIATTTAATIPAAALVPASLSAGYATSAVADEATRLADRYRYLSARLGGGTAGPSSVGGVIAGGVALSIIKAVLKSAFAANPQGFNLRDAALGIFRGLLGAETDQAGPARNEIEDFLRGIVHELGQGQGLSPNPNPSPNLNPSPNTTLPIGPGGGTYSIQGTVTLTDRAGPPAGAPPTASSQQIGTINRRGLLEPDAATATTK